MSSRKGGKRLLVGSTDANKSVRRKPLNKSFICPVCEEAIKDPSPTSEGQESIFCKGTCSTLLHRKCAGLSKKAFQNVSNSNKLFLCPYCVINKDEEDIETLKTTIQDLTNQLSSIQTILSEPGSSITTTVSKTTSHESQQEEVNSSHPNHPPSSFERNFNVVYGIKESPTKTARPARAKHDQENLTSIFASFDPSIKNFSIKDSHRLGRHRSDQTHPRAILVKFLRAIDAQTVLVNRDKVSQPIIIKPDMSKQDRDIQSILLRERWNFIQTGTN